MKNLKNFNLKELTVLYVEDEIDVLEEVSDMLSLKVGRLFTAQNGLQALEIYKNETIDIIITDIQMPTMNGIELITKIREENQEIPIVITTAFNEVEFLKNAIDLNVDKYITKPIDITQLFSVLKRASVTIFQKKEIAQRDQIIKTILDMKPYYSIIIDANNIQRLDGDLFSNLSFGNDDELILQYKIDDYPCHTVKNTHDLVEKILLLKESSNIDETICLSKKDSIGSGYLLKPYFFENTDLFMLSFFENECIDKSDKFSTCFSCASGKSL